MSIPPPSSASPRRTSPPGGPIPHTQSQADVKETSRLAITVTVESRSRRKTVYRAVQRADGVIVERPRYRPSTFLPASLVNKSPSGSRPSKDVQCTAAVSEGPLECERSGCHAVWERGRNGCEHTGRTLQDPSLASHKDNPRGIEVADPMQRFLEEPGPWSILDARATLLDRVASV